jgi:hypothetical protein
LTIWQAKRRRFFISNRLLRVAADRAPEALEMEARCQAEFSVLGMPQKFCRKLPLADRVSSLSAIADVTVACAAGQSY